MMSRRVSAYVIVAAVGIGLAGCGYNQGDRAVSGAAIGAGGGAVLGAIGGNAGLGALAGGAAGALTGALTSPNDINLGKPVWR
jgi:hypothetical protein